jgi:hypothetical protein
MLGNSLKITPRWKPCHIQSSNEKWGPSPSMEAMKEMEKEELDGLRLQRIRYNHDGKKIFNLQFEMNDGSRVPPDEAYVIEGEEN